MFDLSLSEETCSSIPLEPMNVSPLVPSGLLDLGALNNSSPQDQLALSSGFDVDYINQNVSTGLGTNVVSSVAADPLAPQAAILVADDYTGNTTTTGVTNINNFAIGNIETLGDSDWFRVNLTAGNTYQFRMNGLSLADSYLYLRNSAGGQITYNDDGGGNLNSLITYTATTTGTYYLDAQAYGSAYTGGYTISAALGSLVDDYAPVNSSTMGTVAVNGSTTGNIQVGTDSDWFRVNLVAGNSYQFRMNGVSLSDSFLYLRDSAGGQITYNDDSGGNGNSLIAYTPTTTGTYYLDARSYGSYYTGTYTVSVSTGSSGDWYSQNLRDAELITLTRSLASDNNLSRTDMISIFRNAEDGGVIDSNELTDMRTLVTNATRFTMQDSVRVLSNKLVNGNSANQWWTGGGSSRTSLGNLYAGSSTTQMERLISKWFLGGDRPVSGGGRAYSYTNGSLFQNGVSFTDIRQGALGDCYYMATLGAMANDKPATVSSLFTDNGDNTFTVRIFNNGVADYVTVDRYLPVDAYGRLAYANMGDYASSSSNELWVALAEKAYAQVNESGWLQRGGGMDGINAYTAIEGGWMDKPIRQLTGLSTGANYVANVSAASLINLVNSNQLVTIGLFSGAYGTVDGHAYTITSYNASNGTFHLQNPWGTRHSDLTWSQLASFGSNAYLIWSLT